MTEVYKVWCEWDIGVEGLVYSSYEVAEKNAIHRLKLYDIAEPFDELENEGYIGIDVVEIIKK